MLVALLPSSVHAGDLSAVRIGDAPLLSPTSALGFYGSPSSPAAKPASDIDSRIQALARGLKYDPDLIYEHVRNHIEFSPMFGLQKGGVGAMLDGAGTAFDQAHLMVTLLRYSATQNAGIGSVSYKLGQVSVDGAEFDAWFGLTNAKAACELLGGGGIPATVNGSTDCASLSGAVTNVTLLHVWVEAQIDGGLYVFDPARKAYETIPGIGLAAIKSAMNFSASSFFSPSTDATTGTENGVPYVTNINYTKIENNLQSYAQALLGYLKSSMPGASLEEVVGGRRIVPWHGDPLRQTTVPGQAAVNATWGGEIPNEFRTRVTIWVEGGGDDMNDDGVADREDFTYESWADDLYGRKVTLGPDEINPGGPFSYEYNNLHLRIDGVSVGEIERGVRQLGTDCPDWRAPNNGYPTEVHIQLDHPYAAETGAYMDRSFETWVNTESPAVLIFGFGEVRSGGGYNASREKRYDWRYSSYPYQYYFNFETQTFDGGASPASGSVKTKQEIGHNFLNQLSQMMRIVRGLFGIHEQHHHSFGISSSRTQHFEVQDWQSTDNTADCQTFVGQSGLSVDILSGLSVTSDDGTQAAEDRAEHLIVSASAMLEGSVAQQVQDSTFAITPQSRITWAVKNLGGEKFYLVDSSNIAAAEALLGGPSIYSAAIGAYAATGSSVLAPASSTLGPGPEWGQGVTVCSAGVCGLSFRASLHRGGAFAAFNNNGDIAYMLRNWTGTVYGSSTKGAGAAEELEEFDPTKLPDVMEEDYGLRAGLVDGVSLNSGGLSYSAPADISTGSGSFPYSLNFQRSFKAGLSHSKGLPDGWTHNWDFRANFGNDGMETLGVSTPQNAAASIAAMVAADALLDAGWDAPHILALQITENWWRTRMIYNMVTLTLGTQSIPFYKQVDGSFAPPPGQKATLVQTGDRVLKDTTTSGTYNKPGRWQYKNIDLTYTSAMGDVIVFDGTEWNGVRDEARFGFTDYSKHNEVHQATSWTFPYGMTLTFTYAADFNGINALQPLLKTVQNNLGRSLTFDYTFGKTRALSIYDPDTGQSSAVTQGARPQIASITAGDGRAVTMNTAGTEVTRPDGTTVKYAYATAVAGARPIPYPHLAEIYAASDPDTPHLTVSYDEDWRVTAITDRRGSAWNFHVAGSRGEIVDPTGASTVSYFDDKGRTVRSVDPLGGYTETVYNGIGLPVEQLEYWKDGVCGGADEDKFDRKTVTSYNIQWWQASEEKVYPAECEIPNPTDSDDLIVTSRTYRTDYPLVATETDPRGKTTTNTYNSTTTRLTAVDGPSGERMELSYNGSGRVTQKKTKASAAEWLVMDFGWDAEGNLTSRTKDPGGANESVTSFGYDGAGNAISVTDPRSNVSTIAYDNRRRLIRLTRPLGAVAEVDYDADGKVTEIRHATGLAAPDDWARTKYEYTPTFKVAKVTDPEGNITRYRYTERDEVELITDPEGRVTKTFYNAAGQAIREIRAFGTELEQVYREVGYHGATDLVVFVKDANGNQTLYDYDAYGRQYATTFPDSTFENLTYDKAGNILTKLTRAGQTISFTYDDSSRQVSKAGAQVDDITTAYDLVGRVTSITAASGQSLTNAWDSAGRVVSVTDQASRVISYQYDDAGNRTRLTHPDGYFVDYTYDALNRMAAAVENGTLTLATFGYDVQSRTTSLTYGNGTSVSFDYEPDSDLKEMVHTFISGGWALSVGGTGIEYSYSYTKSHQLKNEGTNAAPLQFEPSNTQAITYAVNSLNQYTNVTTDGQLSAMGYDQNGNLTGDSVNSFTYDAENKLLTAAMGGGTNVSYTYDPMARRTRKTVDGVATDYVHDDTHVIAEYDGSGAVLRRYVHGPGTDRPIAMVEGDVGSGYTHSYYHVDRLGSVVTLTDDSGAPVTHYTYDAYGVPFLVDPLTGAQTQVAAGQPYLFTGRRFDFETGLYYYRARYYSASLGRFLQADPVGYEDQMNLYAYANNDPSNQIDPTGKAYCGDLKGQACIDAKTDAHAARDKASNAAALLTSAASKMRGEKPGALTTAEKNMVNHVKKFFGDDFGKSPDKLDKVAGELNQIAARIGPDRPNGGAMLNAGDNKPELNEDGVWEVPRAYTRPSKEKYTIYFNSDFLNDKDSIARQRTVLHEAAHLTLGISKDTYRGAALTDAVRQRNEHPERGITLEYNPDSYACSVAGITKVC